MNIFIPYKHYFIGGPAIFLALLTEQLRLRGHHVSRKMSHTFDVLLIISSCSLLYVLFAKMRGIKIIQRLDGVYHSAIPGVNGRLYCLKNLRAQIIHNWLADYIVYQSKFSRSACLTMLGNPRGKTSIIYNGVDINFRQSRSRSGSAVRLISYANWRRLDQIEPIIASTKLLPTNFTLTLYGPRASQLDKFFKSFSAHPQISYVGEIAHGKLLKVIPRFDIFLFADQSACPNSVLESLAAGLPVVAFARGAIPELVINGRTGYVIKLGHHNPLKEMPLFLNNDLDSFAQAIQKVASRLPFFQQRAFEDSRRNYNIKKIAAVYEDLFVS